MRAIFILLAAAAAALATLLTAGAASGSAIGWGPSPCYQIVSGDPHGFHSTVWVCPHQSVLGHARLSRVRR